MKKIIAAPTVSAEISYDDMKGIDDVTGEFYEMYRKQFKQYAPSVALKNTIKATNIRKNGLIDVYEQRKELLNKKI